MSQTWDPKAPLSVSVKLLLKMHNLLLIYGESGLETQAYSELADEADAPWYAMNEEEQACVRQLSTLLNLEGDRYYGTRGVDVLK